MTGAIIFLILELVLLVFSADWLVKGAASIASALGISPLVVGLTVVAFGTSAPELAVSVMFAFNGQADLALGNVVGSNIFNVLFILGISALIIPLVVNAQLVRFDVPVMIAVSVLLYVLSMDGLQGICFLREAPERAIGSEQRAGKWGLRQTFSVRFIVLGAKLNYPPGVRKWKYGKFEWRPPHLAAPPVCSRSHLTASTSPSARKRSTKPLVSTALPGRRVSSSG